MLVVRPAGSADFDALMELAELSGRGFTSLPEDEPTLRARLALSEASFQAGVAPPVDEALLAALASGMPACSGVAMGVDRLLMAMLDTSRIADVVAFDFARG